MSAGPILVINPNSSVAVTEAISTAIEPLSLRQGPVFETMRVEKGPSTIATAEHAAKAGLDVAEVIRSRPDASAFVIACFSDPGLDLCRTLVPQPVIGIQEAGILSAMARADLFGIVALGPASIARHRLRIRQMGVEARMVAEREHHAAHEGAEGPGWFRRIPKAHKGSGPRWFRRILRGS